IEELVGAAFHHLGRGEPPDSEADGKNENGGDDEEALHGAQTITISVRDRKKFGCPLSPCREAVGPGAGRPGWRGSGCWGSGGRDCSRLPSGRNLPGGSPECRIFSALCRPPGWLRK